MDWSTAERGISGTGFISVEDGGGGFSQWVMGTVFSTEEDKGHTSEENSEKGQNMLEF